MGQIEPLDAIEAREKAATPGPWWSKHPAPGPWWSKHPESDPEIRCQGALLGRCELSVADIEFVVEARTDVPRLVAAVRYLLKEAADMDSSPSSTARLHLEGRVAEILRGERTPDAIAG